MRKTASLLITFLILSGCASKPAPIKKRLDFRPMWSFTFDEKGKELICMDRKDMFKLRKFILQCRGK